MELVGAGPAPSLDALARDWPGFPCRWCGGRVHSPGAPLRLGWTGAWTPRGDPHGMGPAWDARNPAAGTPAEVEWTASVARVVDGGPDSTLIRDPWRWGGRGWTRRCWWPRCGWRGPSRVAGVPLDAESLTGRLGRRAVHCVPAVEPRSPGIRLSGRVRRWRGRGSPLLPGEAWEIPLLDHGRGEPPSYTPPGPPRGRRYPGPRACSRRSRSGLEARSVPGSCTAPPSPGTTFHPLDLEVLRWGRGRTPLPTRAELALGGISMGGGPPGGPCPASGDGSLEFQTAWGLSLPRGRCSLLRDPLHEGSPMAGRIPHGTWRWGSVASTRWWPSWGWGRSGGGCCTVPGPPPPGGDQGEDRPLRPVPDTTAPPGPPRRSASTPPSPWIRM